jgi:hypothetical protein
MLGFYAPDSFVCSARSSTLGGVSSCVGFLWGVLTTNTTTTNVSTFFFVLFVLVGRVSPRESSHGARQQPPRSWTDEVVLPLDPDLEPFPCSAKRPVGKKIELARGLEPLTCCFSAAGIEGLWPGAIVWRLA